jgi:beta-lactamase superfamily II metal-dependent hydrolase
VQALRVNAIADSGQSYGGRAFRDCITEAQRQHNPVFLARRGMQYVTDDGVTFNALPPDEPLLVGSNDVNENSVVLRLAYRCPECDRTFRMLFTGDAGRRTLPRLGALDFARARPHHMVVLCR